MDSASVRVIKPFPAPPTPGRLQPPQPAPAVPPAPSVPVAPKLDHQRMDTIQEDPSTDSHADEDGFEKDPFPSSSTAAKSFEDLTDRLAARSEKASSFKLQRQNRIDSKETQFGRKKEVTSQQMPVMCLDFLRIRTVSAYDTRSVTEPHTINERLRRSVLPGQQMEEEDQWKRNPDKTTALGAVSVVTWPSLLPTWERTRAHTARASAPRGSRSPWLRRTLLGGLLCPLESGTCPARGPTHARPGSFSASRYDRLGALLQLLSTQADRRELIGPQEAKAPGWRQVPPAPPWARRPGRAHLARGTAVPTRPHRAARRNEDKPALGHAHGLQVPRHASQVRGVLPQGVCCLGLSSVWEERGHFSPNADSL
eukprot:bmy_17689T0